MIFPLSMFSIIGCILVAGLTKGAAPTLGNTKYVVFGQGTHYSAAEICFSAGMRLVDINDQGKSDEVTYYVNKESAISGPFYTSISRLYDGVTWSFPDGSPVKYFNWDDGAPNDISSKEKCVEINKHGRWNDVECSSLRYALCEVNY